MADQQKKPQLSTREVEALARETGCTENQIREIVSLVGFDRASIIREARTLGRAMDSPGDMLWELQKGAAIST